MKTTPKELLVIACLAAWAIAPRSEAQTPPVLDVHLYAGLTITGEVGTVYSVEYITDLAQTNDASAWRCSEYLQLPASPYLWADKSSPVTGQRFYRAVAMEAPTNMVFIPPGTFRMGSPTNEVDRYEWEGPQMAVTISRGFWLGKYEVTQAKYEALTGNNPSWCNGDRTSEGGPDFGIDPMRPVDTVSWNDAKQYCAQLTQQEAEAGRIPAGSVYRLPTEAEWEYACRAQTSTRFSFGDDPGYGELNSYAWYEANGGGGSHPVGQQKPNPWGLYDMHGNVWEFCSDWFSSRLSGGTVIDPQGPLTGTEVVYRGGSWGYGARGTRSAFRHPNMQPSFRFNDFGLRVVLAPAQP